MMNISLIEKFLETHLLHSLPNHPVKEIYRYAVLPGGKYFRPQLVWSILKDLNPGLYAKSQHAQSAHALLSSAVEIHHTYTLLHDDLPCMDDDTLRRGKPCTHIAYGEWQALLTGDGLLSISYQLLSRSRHPRSLELLSFFSWATGPKGLIHGQVMDLSQEMTKSLTSTIRTHELKTARLIQAAILGSAILTNTQPVRKVEKRLWRYSVLLGINFQLIDDLSELTSAELSDHEKDVNPWLKFTTETFDQTIMNLEKFHKLAAEMQLSATNAIVNNYYEKMLKEIVPGRSQIEAHLGGKCNLSPLILLLKSFR